MKDELIPESKSSQIKKILIDVILSSSAHGLPNIIRSKIIFLKIFWAFFFLISFGYCSCTIIKTINSYLNKDCVTNIDVIREIPTEFPAVSICNLNIYGTDFAKNILNNLIPKEQNSFKFKTISEAFNYSNQYFFLFQSIVLNTNVTNEERKNLSLSLEDFLIYCEYGFELCNIDKFDWFYDKFYGNCFTFNNGRNSIGKNFPIYNVSQGGIFKSLKLLLYLGNQSDIPELVQSSGVHVFIHNKSVMPNSFEGVDASNGEQTNIIISRLFESKLEYPYSDCKSNLNSPDAFDSDIFRATFDFRKYYTQKDCFEGCLQREINTKCYCSASLFVRINDLKDCENPSEISCAMIAADDFYNQDINTKCSPYCPRECDSITYSLSVSHSFFPNPKFSDFLISHPTIQTKFQLAKTLTNDTKLFTNDSVYIDKDELKKSLAMININYDDVKYTKVSQIPKMTFEDLLANIGGQLGLFIGISFLSFVEIIDTLIQIIFINLDKSDNNKVFP